MKKNADGYYTNRHSCFLIQYHLVLVTKFRHPVITGDLEKALKCYLTRYFSYFIGSVSDRTEAAVRNYINNQKTQD